MAALTPASQPSSRQGPDETGSHGPLQARRQAPRLNRAGDSAEPLLVVENLSVTYTAHDATSDIQAVDDVSFAIKPGETLGIVGESGSGKTTLALALLRLLPPNAKVVSGDVLLRGSPLLSVPRRDLDRLRWNSVSIAFQGAMNALNPVQRVIDQVAEPLRIHKAMSAEAARRSAREYLERVGIPADRVGAYPHELSGGMRQRAVIAMALICEPELVIADEPGTALDVVVQRQILDLLVELQEELRLAMIVISHDLSIIEFLTHRCLVMYGGRLMEEGDTDALFRNPAHPYLQMLTASFPRLDDEKLQLVAMGDRPIDLAHRPSGCVFHPRCSYSMAKCETYVPPFFESGPNHAASCWLLEPAQVHTDAATDS